MSEEVKVQDATTPDFYNDVDWSMIKGNVISKEDFIKIKAKNKKMFATFLGPKESPSFYMFKPLKWGIYKDIRSRKLDKEAINDYVLNSCVVWPIMDPIQIADEDAGIVHTLIYQIMSVSNFLSSPEKALELIYEV